MFSFGSYFSYRPSRIFKSLLMFLALLTGQQAQTIPVDPAEPLDLDMRIQVLAESLDVDIHTTPYNLPALHNLPAVLVNRYGLHTRPAQLEMKIGTAPRTVSLEPALWLGTVVRPGQGLFLYNEMVLRPTASSYEIVGKTWRGMTAYTMQAFIRYERDQEDGKSIHLQAGRFPLRYGPSRKSQLLLSTASRPLDQVFLRAGLGNLFFTWNLAALDPVAGQTRYLGIHRLQWVEDHWQIGLSEAGLQTLADNATTFLANPFQFYHLQQVNNPSVRANTLFGIDARVRLGGLSLYAEGMIDDFQIDRETKGDLEPAEIGVTVGAEGLIRRTYLGFEFTAITNRSYKTPQRTEWFLHRGLPLGDMDGSDFYRANLALRHPCGEKILLDMELNHLVRGEGEWSRSWDEPWLQDEVTLQSGYHEPFPTGVLETSNSLEARVTRIWSRYRWAALQVRWEDRQNASHDPQADPAGTLEGRLLLSWVLERGLID